MNVRSITLVFAVLLVVASPVAAEHPPRGPGCDPDKIYAGEEFAFDEAFIFPGPSEDGLLVDDVDRVAAFLDLVDTQEHDEDHGNGKGEDRGRKATYIYAVYGTLGDLCDT